MAPAKSAALVSVVQSADADPGISDVTSARTNTRRPGGRDLRMRGPSPDLSGRATCYGTCFLLRNSLDSYRGAVATVKAIDDVPRAEAFRSLWRARLHRSHAFTAVPPRRRSRLARCATAGSGRRSLCEGKRREALHARLRRVSCPRTVSARPSQRGSPSIAHVRTPLGQDAVILLLYGPLDGQPPVGPGMKPEEQGGESDVKDHTGG